MANSLEKILTYIMVAVVVVSAVLVAYSLVAPPSRALGLPSGVIVPQQPHVALLRITGTLSYTPSLLNPLAPTVNDYIKTIEGLRISPFVSAVVLYINSPGGEAGACYELFEAVKRLAETKPVVVYTPEMLTSGAYLVALPAKTIVASPFATIGSIGVVLTVPKAGSLLNKLGIKVYVLKNGSLKDIGSPYTTNMSSRERRILQSIVNDIYSSFVRLVKKYRPRVSEDVFSSAIYSAREALAKGLIDEIGGLDKAVSEARKLAGLPPAAPLVEYSATRSLLDILLGGRIAIAPGEEKLIAPQVLLLPGG